MVYEDPYNSNKADVMLKMLINDDVEKDQEIIAEYYAKGMSKADFSMVMNLNKETKKIDIDYIGYAYKPYNFEKFLSYQEIEQMIYNLAASKAVNFEIIGESVDGRNIYSLSIGFGQKTIMFETGIHAAEGGNVLFMMKYLNDLVHQYEQKDEDIIKLLNEVKIVVVPLVNPDGYLAHLFGYQKLNNQSLYAYQSAGEITYSNYKANANGIDINRSFPSQHGGLYYRKYQLSRTVSFKPTLGKMDYYAGEILGSEPETRGIMYWQHKYLSQSFAYISLHSAGRVIYAGKPNLSERINTNSQVLARIVSDINGYLALGPADEEVGIGSDGTATDFAAELVSGFNFSTKTGRLSADAYLNPTLKSDYPIGIITLETLEKYAFTKELLKKEYEEMKLAKVFTTLIKSYEQIK